MQVQVAGPDASGSPLRRRVPDSDIDRLNLNAHPDTAAGRPAYRPRLRPAQENTAEITSIGATEHASHCPQSQSTDGTLRTMTNPLRVCLIAALMIGAYYGSAVAEPVTINTRFGSIKNNSDDLLEFKGKLLKPDVAVVSSAYVVATFKLASSDVVLVSQAAGNACPGQYVYVTIDADAAKVSPTFGTCYDEQIKPVQVGESVAFAMKKVKGKGSVRYIYERGIVFEDGKPLK